MIIIDTLNNDRIVNARNRVFINDMAIGKNLPNAMSTVSTSVYRVIGRKTGTGQITDIINSGYVRPKETISTDPHHNEIFWTQGGDKTFYMTGNSMILEAPAEKVHNNQIGAIPFEDLIGIWVYNENENKYINQIDYFRQLYRQKHSDLPTYTTLEDLSDILNENGYFCLGHGTGRSGNSDEVVNSIFNTGLRTKDNSLYYTSIGLDTGDIKTLKTKLENWQHQDSQKIILMRIPVEYVNMFGDSADLDGEKFGAFYNEVQSQDGKITYYLDPKFIIGCYDVEKQRVLLNKKFERVLNEDTLGVLKDKYRQALEKTQKRIKRQEESLNIFSNNNLETQQVNNTQLGDNLEWDLSDFGDDIDWGLEENGGPKKR